MGQYMSPYMQNVVEQQQKDAIRQADIARQGTQAQAVQAGAFGGSRSAIVEAENQRGLQDRLAMIQATGTQSAYDKAQQAQQFGANLGLQGLQAGYQGLQTGMQGTAQGIQGAQAGMQGAGLGLQGVGQQIAGGQLGLSGAGMGIQGQQAGMQGTAQGLAGVQAATGAGQYGLQGLGAAGSAASTLGALGQTQYGQEMGISQAQMQAGALQQAQQQRGLDIAYQQYQDQLNYPYKQLAFQSDMFRGLPLSQSATTMYQNTGAMAPQLLGAGIAAYGATQRAKEGGLVKGYAEGGTTTVDPSVPSSIGPQALSSRLAKLSDEQLMAYARTVKDAVALAEVKGEIQRRQEARQPQGEMPTGTVAQSMMPQEAMAQPPMMAGGGIVALRNGGSGGDQVEIVQDYNKVADDFKTEDLRNRLLGRAQAAAGPLGGFFHTTDQRDQARAKIKELGAATPEELRSYAASGMMPQVQYGADQGQPISPMLAANAVSSAAQGVQAQDVDSQVTPGQVSPQQLLAMTEAANREDMAEQQAQDADNQVEAYTTSAAPSVSPNAPPGTVPGGIVPSRATVAGAPAGQAPAGQAPVAGAPSAPAGIVPSSKAPAAMAGGAVPVANPGDPMGWGAYKANVDDMAKLDPEQKAVLDDMRKRTERRMSRAEKQEGNASYDAMIAGGLAMMSGMNLSDGVRRLATIGGQKYFESTSEARKAIEKADDAQDAFNQYQLSLKQGNKKVAAEMYGKYYGTMMDFNGKIKAAGISASASMANAQATREATEVYRKDQIEQRNLDRDALMQRHAENVSARENEFKIRMQESGNTKVFQQMQLLDGRQKDLFAERRQTEADVYKRFQNRIDQLNMLESAGKPLTEAQLRQKNALIAEYNSEVKKKLDPINRQIEDIVIRKGDLMDIPSPNSSSGGFRVIGVR
jgi:hypothetical protein